MSKESSALVCCPKCGAKVVERLASAVNFACRSWRSTIPGAEHVGYHSEQCLLVEAGLQISGLQQKICNLENSTEREEAEKRVAELKMQHESLADEVSGGLVWAMAELRAVSAELRIRLLGNENRLPDQTKGHIEKIVEATDGIRRDLHRQLQEILPHRKIDVAACSERYGQLQHLRNEVDRLRLDERKNENAVKIGRAMINAFESLPKDYAVRLTLEPNCHEGTVVLSSKDESTSFPFGGYAVFSMADAIDRAVLHAVTKGESPHAEDAKRPEAESLPGGEPGRPS